MYPAGELAVLRQLLFVDAVKNKNVGHSSYREEICA